jgi:hypothetical protein
VQPVIQNRRAFPSAVRRRGVAPLFEKPIKRFYPLRGINQLVNKLVKPII